MPRNQIWLSRDNTTNQKQIVSCRMSLMISLVATAAMKKTVTITITNKHNYSWHYSSAHKDENGRKRTENRSTVFVYIF